jgi:hypothetical protein
VAKAAQIGGEHLSQIHARSEAICSTFTPRYTERTASCGVALPRGAAESVGDSVSETEHSLAYVEHDGDSFCTEALAYVDQRRCHLK